MGVSPSFRCTVITNVFAPRMGGVEVIADLIARRLGALGASVVVLTKEPGSDSPKSPYEVRRVTRWRDGWRHLAGADLVVVFGPILEILLCCKLARWPTIVSNQIMSASPGFSGRLRRWLIRRLTSRVAEVACSHSLAATLGRPATVISNPLRDDFAISLDGPPRGQNVLYSGRFVPEKGIALLMESFAQLTAHGSEPTLTLVGEGPELAALQTHARELKISDRVTFVPRRHGAELQDIYRRHSVLAVPSTWEEPFGLVALEGLASGCRVVVTDRGGLPEAVGNVGKVVAPTPEALARGLAEALAEAEASLSVEAASAIRAHLARHRPETFVAALLQLAAARWPHLAPKIESLSA